MYITFSIFYKLDIRKQYKSSKYQRTVTYIVRMYRSGLNKSNKLLYNIVPYCIAQYITIVYLTV